MKELPSTEFTHAYVRLNCLEREFVKWHFEKGMCFGDSKKWWGDKGERKTLHEGVDLFSYLDREHTITRCAQGSLVPPLWPGEVAAIFTDFLGQSILFRHSVHHQEFQLCSILGHVGPCDGVGVGSVFSDPYRPASHFLGDGKKTTVPKHLHISVLWCVEKFINGKVDWETIHKSSRNLVFIDPFSMSGLKS